MSRVEALILPGGTTIRHGSYKPNHWTLGRAFEIRDVFPEEFRHRRLLAYVAGCGQEGPIKFVDPETNERFSLPANIFWTCLESGVIEEVP